MRKIGIFAGAFDPIHDGHLEAARSVLGNLGLDAVYFMVEPKPWGEKQPIPIAHRRKMVDIAVIDDVRLRQLELPDDQFSLEVTLPRIENKFPDSELYFIFGADVFMKINAEQWPGLERLKKHYIVVLERKDILEPEISTQVRALGVMTAILPSPLPHHSSTDVRIKPDSKHIWVPEGITNYINQNKLY